jgi:diaminohydroxyphosphoribosylaminopyrimidine deaminase / 5-amino-6-(5-phosphoribosylamino)uracil reductase
MGKTPKAASVPGHCPYATITSAPADRPFVVAQLGQSLDGRIATPTGESRWINRHAALTHVHQVRATVDAVMVGIGTVAADDPILNVRHVEGRNPARVVIDPSGRMSHKARSAADALSSAPRMRRGRASFPPASKSSNWRGMARR